MMQSIGQTLQAARQQKKATLEDASRATKIKVEILARLEADDFKQLGAAMYVKAHLKLYADFLGLDSKLIGDTYLQSQGGLRRHGLRLETEAALMAERQHRMRLPAGAVIGIVSIVSAVLLAWWGVHLWRAHRATVQNSPPKSAVATTTVKAPTLPRAGFDPIYQPKKQPIAETLDK